MIKCSCGNKGCTTVLYLDIGTRYVNLKIGYDEGTKQGDTPNRFEGDIALEPNTIIQLIKELKNSLNDLTNQ